LPDNPDVEVKLLQRDDVHYLLARSKPRRAKERAIRRRQRRGLAKALKKLVARVAQGRLVLAYALWKTLDHLAKRAGLQTLINKPDPRRGNAAPKARPMSPEVILRTLSQIQIGDILLETTAGQQLVLRRIARPNTEQRRILDALDLTLPERLSADRLL